MDTDILSGLRDVHIPEPIENYLWPPALGWWLLLALIFILPLLLRIIHIQRIRSARIYALKEMDKYALTYADNPAKFAQSVSVLLRRIAILKYGKEKVASLSGIDWVSFLVKTGELKIKRSLAMLFAVAPYSRPQKLAPQSVAELKDAALQWIRKNT